jgi:Flp pilus assembly protein TadG
MLEKFWHNRRGATATVVALSLPALVGAAAFGAEAGFWTYRQRLLQQYADAAAFASAIELQNGGNAPAINSAAGDSLNSNGLRSDGGSFTVMSPPASGPFAGTSAVEVSVEEEWPRFFTAMLFDGTVTIAAKATAHFEEFTEACMLALDTTASGAATLTGSTSVYLNGCSLISNSNASNALSISGSSVLHANCVGAAGGISSTSTGITLSECSAPRPNMVPVKDPYASVPEPTVSGPCKTPNNLGGASSSVYNITEGRYCGLRMSRTVNLAPGMYIIDGGELDISSTASINGSGVTFFLTNGARLNINGAAVINLAAPTSGTYSGLLFFGDRTGTPVSNLLNGSAGSVFNGATYFPNDHLEIRGSNSVGAGCTQFIARTLDLRGSSGAGVDCSTSGTTSLDIMGKVRLVQ